MGKKAETKIVNDILFKECTKCGEFRPLTQFHNLVTGYLGKHAYCRKCKNELTVEYNREAKKNWSDEKKESVKEYSRNYYKENRSLLLSKDRTRRYNLTEQEFQELAKSGCTVCGSFDRLCVDHDHKTNQVRGILCTTCNTALGLLNEDENRILKLAAYIKESVVKDAI